MVNVTMTSRPRGSAPTAGSGSSASIVTQAATGNANAGYADKAGTAAYADAAAVAARANKADVASTLSNAAAEIDSTGAAVLTTVTTDSATLGSWATPAAAPGVTGHGAQITTAPSGLATLHVDEIVTRQGIIAPAFTVQEIKPVGGVLVMSAANGVVTESEAGMLTVELGAGEFVVGDWVRWSTVSTTGVTAGRGFVLDADSAVDHKQVFSLVLSAGTMPTPGTALVQFGSMYDEGRRNVTVLSCENGDQGISVHTDVTTGLLTADTLRARFGLLSGIQDPELGTLTGYGLWADRAYLRGAVTARSVVCTGATGAKQYTVNEGDDPAARVYLPSGGYVRYGYLSVEGVDTVAQCYSADGTMLWCTPAQGDGGRYIPSWRREQWYVTERPPHNSRGSIDYSPWVFGTGDQTRDPLDGVWYMPLLDDDQNPVDPPTPDTARPITGKIWCCTAVPVDNTLTEGKRIVLIFAAGKYVRMEYITFGTSPSDWQV